MELSSIEKENYIWYKPSLYRIYPVESTDPSMVSLSTGHIVQRRKESRK